MNRFLSVILSIFSLILLIPDFTPCAGAQEVKIVAHPDVPRYALSQDEIQQIFLGRNTQWDENKEKIHFITLEGGDVHEQFVRRFVGKTSSQYGNYWRKMVFTGKGRAPKSLKDPEDVVAYVANTRGAIGYVPSETDTKDVGIISVTPQ